MLFLQAFLHPLHLFAHLEPFLERWRGNEKRLDGYIRARRIHDLLAAIEDLETGCAVGAHAERMRLERIEVIAGDPEAPADIRAVFARILAAGIIPGDSLASIRSYVEIRRPLRTCRGFVSKA